MKIDNVILITQKSWKFKKWEKNWENFRGEWERTWTYLGGKKEKPREGNSNVGEMKDKEC